MRFNKEKGISKIYFIDVEEVNEEVFYSTLEEALSNEYDEGAFNSYLRDNYCDVCIEGYYYEAFDILDVMGDYSNAYDEWLEAKTQEILEDFNEGRTQCMSVYGSYFEIREAEETHINIELTKLEAKILYLALDPNKSISNSQISLTTKAFFETLSKMVESEDQEQC